MNARHFGFKRTLSTKMRHYAAFHDMDTRIHIYEYIIVVDLESDSLENAHRISTKTNDTISKAKTLTQSMELYDK